MIEFPCTQGYDYICTKEYCCLGTQSEKIIIWNKDNKKDNHRNMNNEK